MYFRRSRNWDNFHQARGVPIERPQQAGLLCRRANAQFEARWKAARYLFVLDAYP